MKAFKERGFNDELDLDTLFTVFLNRINPLIYVFTISLVIISLIYIFQERIYQSTALLQFEDNSSSLLPNSVESLSRTNITLTAEKEIFKSINTVEGVTERLSDKYEDIPSYSSISKGLSFSDDGRNLLTIKFANNDVDITKDVLGSLIDEFITDRIENNRIAAVKGIEFVEIEIPKLKVQLDSAEKELTDFRSTGGNSLFFDNTNRGESIESLKKEIKEIELKEIELREFYKSSHPIYSTLLEQKNILMKELEDEEYGVQDLPIEQRKLFNLNQKVNIYSSSLEELERQKLSLSLLAASSTSNVKIINFPSDAMKISPRITLLFFSFLFFLLAYFIFLLNHFFTDKIMSLDALIDYLEDRDMLLGAFPFISKNQNKQKILIEIEKNFVDRVIVNILNSDNKIYLITSMKEGVGKSYFSEKISTNLSKFSEKVCLIDLDLRKKGISDYSKSFKEEGISTSDYMISTSVSSNCTFIKKPEVDNPLTYLNSQKLEELIEKLKIDFDKIIIDSPPLGTFIDAKIISSKVDQTICILSSHESSFAEISSISKELKNNGQKEILFFLNKVRYFLEIFWFNVRYPIYGNYNYYNPYNYYYSDGTKSFRKLKKYVSFAQEFFKKVYLKALNLKNRYFK